MTNTTKCGLILTLLQTFLSSCSISYILPPRTTFLNTLPKSASRSLRRQKSTSMLANLNSLIKSILLPIVGFTVFWSERRRLNSRSWKLQSSYWTKTGNSTTVMWSYCTVWLCLYRGICNPLEIWTLRIYPCSKTCWINLWRLLRKRLACQRIRLGLSSTTIQHIITFTSILLILNWREKFPSKSVGPSHFMKLLTILRIFRPIKKRVIIIKKRACFVRSSVAPNYTKL